MATWRAKVGSLIHAVGHSDDAAVEQAVLRLSQSRRLFAPLALAVGAIVMLIDGVKLLITNWRLTLIQMLPAMWIWIALLDLKAHVLHGDSFHVLRGPVVIPIVLAVAAITAASFFLNAVFAFAIAKPGTPMIGPAFTRARSSLTVILGWGAAVGVCLGVSTVILVRWGQWWFAISLSIIIAVMMVCYVAVPARLIGPRPPIRNGTSSPSPPWAGRSERWSAPRPTSWAASGCSCSAHEHCSSPASSSWSSA